MKGHKTVLTIVAVLSLWTFTRVALAQPDPPSRVARLKRGAPYIYARLRRLATKSCKKCGLNLQNVILAGNERIKNRRQKYGKQQA